jgi:CHAT domain-containing protein/Tfp pilus assembly protein PilF
VPSPEHAVTLARTAIDRGDFVRAQAITEGALQVHGKRDSESVWMLRVLLGEALNSQGDGKRAVEVLGFTLPSKYARSEVAVQHLIQRGMALFIAGKPGMQELFVRARAIAEKHQPQALADVYRALSVSDQANSERHLRQAISLARQHGRRFVEAKAWATLGHYDVKAQRFREAVENMERARAIAEPAGYLMTLQNVQGNLGWAYTELGEYEESLELFRKAEATARRIGAKRDLVPWLIQLGALSYQKRNYAEASRYSRAALDVNPQHPQAGYAYANLASAAIELGRFDEARRFNAAGLAAKEDSESKLLSRVIEARIATQTGNHAGAERLLLDVINNAEKKSTKWEAQARLADVYVRMGKTDSARKSYAKAFETVRDARAAIDDRELRFAFFNLVEEILDLYIDFLVAGNRIEEALAVMERSRAESLEEGREVAARLDARAIAKQNDAVILCYWLGRNKSYVFVVHRDGVKVHDLRNSDTNIEQAVAGYRKALFVQHGGYERVQKTGAELYSMLVAPAGVPKGSRVMIVSDGALHTLNFDTVVPAPGRWWIQDVIVQQAASLQLLHDRRAAKPTGDPSILLVGNTPSPDPAFPKLQYAQQEMSAIARLFPRRTVLEGAKATPAAYGAASPGKHDYVHFVAHGDATRRRPLDSAVILAPDATRSYRLLARDVMRTPLTARLVTISSCNSAGTRTYAGEGVVGLAWAFQKAGADQVIASLWEVNDSVTSQLMEQMYRGIREGRDPAEALREAKLTFVRARDTRRHPRFWAPFVLYAGT